MRLGLFVQICDPECGPLRLESFGTAIGNRMLIGDADDQAGFSFK